VLEKRKVNQRGLNFQSHGLGFQVDFGANGRDITSCLYSSKQILGNSFLTLNNVGVFQDGLSSAWIPEAIFEDVEGLFTSSIFFFIIPS
jgi:hypothetical protein